MKRRRLPAVLLALLVLVGCGAPEGAAAEEAAVPAEAAAPAVGGLTGVWVDSQARPLSEEEILSAYDRAEEAYGWFYRKTMPCGQEARELDGQMYYPVTEAGMENLADLRAYLGGLFSQSLVEELLSTGGDQPLYRDVEGALYVRPSSREREKDKGAVTIQTAPAGDGAYSVDVTVELLTADGAGPAGVECYAFPYEFVDGQWVFTDFRLVC